MRVAATFFTLLAMLAGCSQGGPEAERGADTPVPESESGMPESGTGMLGSETDISVQDTEVGAVAPQPLARADVCASGDGQLLHVPSPDWRDQVIYMLMIDRFDDGDLTNNDQGHGEYDPGQPSHFSGGDFQGVIDRLDYLRARGITAVWITPPLYNQWWSTPYRATGWHGYWPVHFQEVDPHYGTLDDYKRLSHELHCRGMYLIQDTIANHVGNFYAYEGEYDPDDTATGFYLLEPDSHQPGPVQFPFNQIDRLNPEHHAADIYHWTPPITDFSSLHQEHYYSLGHVGDINTENPEVIAKFKEIYKFWIDEVGVDAFRMDTVSLVPFPFWNRLLRDDDGIYAHARERGKEFFLTFGEATAVSDPYDDAGERRVAAYLETDGQLGPNSMLSYPLYHGINRALARGEPSAALGYRLERHMVNYLDPFTMPIFIDNHDTARFLAAGNPAAFRQALALLFTIPGIPIVYQGTEQALPESRMAMFAGGYRNAEGSFDETSEHFRYLRRLTALRTEHPVLVRGGLEVLASESAGPGVLAYRREYGGESVIVLLNTANHSAFAHRLDVGAAPFQRLDVLFAEPAGIPAAESAAVPAAESAAVPAAESAAEPAITGADGRLSLRLPPRAAVVLRSIGETVSSAGPGAEFAEPGVESAGPGVASAGPGVESAERSVESAGPSPESAERSVEFGIVVDAAGIEGAVLAGDFEFTGSAGRGNTPLQLIPNGNFDRAVDFSSDDQGRWRIDVPVRDLGEASHFLQVYLPETDELSERVEYSTRVTEAVVSAQMEDDPDDAYGPTGRYVTPRHPDSARQREIESVSARAAGRNLELTLTMAEITTPWLPPYGFDNVLLTTFFDLPDREGATALPLLDASAPESMDWDLAHFARGWDSYTYLASGSSANRQGDKIGVSPRVSADQDSRTITLFYEGDALGVDDWTGSRIYVTTWSSTAEGDYIDFRAEPADWFFSGGEPGDPKILDDVLLELGAGAR